MTATENILLDWGTWGVVRSGTGKYRLFLQRDDGFPSVRSCVGTYGGLFGVRGTIVRLGTEPKISKIARRSISPVVSVGISQSGCLRVIGGKDKGVYL